MASLSELIKMSGSEARDLRARLRKVANGENASAVSETGKVEIATTAVAVETQFLEMLETLRKTRMHCSSGDVFAVGKNARNKSFPRGAIVSTGGVALDPQWFDMLRIRDERTAACEREVLAGGDSTSDLSQLQSSAESRAVIKRFEWRRQWSVKAHELSDGTNPFNKTQALLTKPQVYAELARHAAVLPPLKAIFGTELKRKFPAPGTNKPDLCDILAKARDELFQRRDTEGVLLGPPCPEPTVKGIAYTVRTDPANRTHRMEQNLVEMYFNSVQ